MSIKPQYHLINMKTRFTWIPVFISLCFHPCTTAFSQTDESNLSKESKLAILNSAAAMTIIWYGVRNWDYGKNGPSCTSEGWFGEDTKDGGADKAGHFYNSYVLANAIAHFSESWGYSKKRAALNGLFSSLGLMTLMEVGDAFSEYGFCHEDIYMNVAGGFTGYLLYKHPEIEKKIDFRMEYRPRCDTADFLTDFTQMKFLMAVKLSGFDLTRDSHLRYLELQTGYFVRGYADEEAEKKRTVYFAIGINLSQILSELAFKKTAMVFRYFQLPSTYIPWEKDL